MKMMHVSVHWVLALGFAVAQAVSNSAIRGGSIGLPSPKLNVSFIADPRAGAAAAANVSVVGFYFPSHNIKVDTACGAPFLGNFWTPAVIRDFAPPNHMSDPHTFICSEACYWASQWWDHAPEFEGLDGQQVFDLAQKLKSAGVPADPTFGGFGTAWKMMQAILRKKFLKGSELAAGLLATEDAYLVEHQEGRDPDEKWSDFCDGAGENWLGLQLMVLRDRLREDGKAKWTAFAASAYDLASGVPLAGKAVWLKTVEKAAAALNMALPYTCPPRITHI